METEEARMGRLLPPIVRKYEGVFGPSVLSMGCPCHRRGRDRRSPGDLCRNWGAAIRPSPCVDFVPHPCGTAEGVVNRAETGAGDGVLWKTV